MINLPDWITAGTAMTAVLGGLFGVYSTTQSRMDVVDERLRTIVEVVAANTENQKAMLETDREYGERILRQEIYAEYVMNEVSVKAR